MKQTVLKEKILEYKKVLSAVAITAIVIVAAFLIGKYNSYNAYYIKPMRYCILVSFIGLLISKKFQNLIKPFSFFNAVYLTYLELEMWQGNNLALPFDGAQMMQIRLVINWFLIAAIILFFSFIFGNLKRGLISSSIGFFILGFFSFLVVEFRGEVLLPTDILALKTAINVAGTYHIPFRSNIFAASLCFYTIFIWILNIKTSKENVRNYNSLRLIYGLLSLLAFWSFNSFEFERFYYPWFIPNNGYVFAISTNLKLLNIDPDKDYSIENIREIILEASGNDIYPDYNANEVLLENFGETKPNIICIMNESFSYFDQFSDLIQTDIELGSFIKSLEDSTIQGDLIVEVFGGGTSDTEFSFFTGLSTKLFPMNARAYELYINERTYSFVDNLRSQGYKTIAMHADKAENWNRDEVYPLIGFEEFLDENEFADSEIIRDIFTSDRATYQKIEEIYESKGNSPLFLFDLTIQNHGSYDQSFNNLDPVNLTNFSNEDYPLLQQYLSLINESDKAFKELVEYFKQVDEPTIICMFGDHLPKLDSDLYDYLTGEDSDKLEDQRKLYTTPFVIWANYDLPEDNTEVLSINYLSTLLTELSGLEETPFNDYLADLYHLYPVIDKKGVQTPEGLDYLYNELELEDYQNIINYNNIIYNYLFEKDKTNSDLYTVKDNS